MNDSSIVTSRQMMVHPRLVRVIEKHQRTLFGQPIKAESRQLFSMIHARWNELGCCDLILDSGCGTGESTTKLALKNPDCLVVGLERSTVKTGKANSVPTNGMVLQGDCIDIWRLMRSVPMRLRAHYWFYPNPWPKPDHLQRRWYAMPVFEDVIALGGQFECRTNWKILAEELLLALERYGVSSEVGAGGDALARRPMTAHEKKYALSGHEIWVVRAVF